MKRRMLLTVLLLASPVVQAETPAERGAYLATAVMLCGRCHTEPGPAARPYAGGRMAETPAYRVQGSNITPDPATGLGRWSDTAIGAALTQGVRPDGSVLAPAMPSAFYAALTEADRAALIAWMRALPAVDNAVAAPVYHTPPSRPVALAPPVPASASDQVTHGAYLGTLARCLGCHSAPGQHGEPDLAAGPGAGGQSFEGPWGTVVAPDITPRGLGTWSDADIDRALTQGLTPDGRTLAAPMQARAYAKMTPDDRAALITWLRTLPASR